MTETLQGVVSDVAELFAASDVPARMAADAVAVLGGDAARELREDPWRLLALPGVRPDQADYFARRVLGGEADGQNPRRGAALTLHLLERAARDGHTLVPAQTVLAALGAFELREPIDAVRAGIDTARVVAVLDETSGEPEELLATAPLAAAEETLAEGLARLTATADPLPGGGGPAREHGVSVVAGPPEAVEEAVRTVLDGVDGEGMAVVATPTERAAQAHGNAMSVHRLLEPRDGGYTRGEDRPLEADLVVVTEAQTLDTERAAALVDACMDGTHLVLAGDPAAPPSIGPGRVLSDVIGSGMVPVTEPRRDPRGAIAQLTDATRGGSLIPIESPDREVVIVPAAEAREAAHRAVQLMTDSIPRALGIPVEEVLVVTPVRRGEAGTTALNRALKERLNPGPGPYDPGDRVVAVADLPLAPAGEIGTVTGTGSGAVAVAFPAGTAEVPATAIRAGWAVTVERAQGTRWPAVVAVLPGEAGGALSRPLAVGAFGRARRHLSVVHAAGPALARAVRASEGTRRRTRLAALLRESMADA